MAFYYLFKTEKDTKYQTVLVFADTQGNTGIQFFYVHILTLSHFDHDFMIMVLRIKAKMINIRFYFCRHHFVIEDNFKCLILNTNSMYSF